MFYLENDQLKIAVDSKGAELKSVVHQKHGLEYMWDADPAYWAKTSPVLFPIVGALKNGVFQYNGQQYALSRHGFAREQEFAVTEQENQSLTFSLQSNDETFAVYPFRFTFSLVYTLHGNELTVTYRIQNDGDSEMYFSVGGHPAFKLPLADGTTYDDYKLVFSEKETAGRWPINPEGLIKSEPEPLLQNTNTLPLAKELFQKDAIVFKHLRSSEVSLLSDKTAHGLRFSFPGFPFLGLWAAPGADFLCIEPWCGIADGVDADGNLLHKEGINQLAPAQEFTASWRVTFF